MIDTKKSIFSAHRPEIDLKMSINPKDSCKTKCTIHKDLDITNFCKEISCLLPLCPECVKNHIIEHKKENNYGDIERIETVLDEAFIAIDKLHNYYIADLSTIENLNNLKRNAISHLEEKINQAKKKIFTIVENYFSTFSQEAIQLLTRQQSAFFEELETSKRFLNNKMQEIENFKNKLRNPQRFIKYIKRLNSTPFYPQNFKYHKEIEQYLELMQQKLIHPVIDDSKLYSFNLELAKFLYLKNAEMYKDEELYKLIPPKPNDNYMPKTNKLSDNSLQKNDFLPKYKSFKDDLINALDDHYKKMTPKSPEKRLMDLSNIMEGAGSNAKKNNFMESDYQKLNPIETSDNKVINYDYSGKKKIQFNLLEDKESANKYSQSKFINQESSEIPYFSKYNFNKDQQSSKPILKTNPDYNIPKNANEFGINLEDYFDENTNCQAIHYFQPKTKKIFLHYLNSSEALSFDEIDLNISFTIPENGKSLITPFGDIYFSGGVSNEKKGKTLNSLYKYNKFQKTLSIKNPFSLARKAHGFIYLGGFLFICGGLNESDENLDACEKYELKTEKWSNMSKMVKKSSYFSLACFSNQFIFKFGGIGTSNTIEKYDVIKDVWSEINYFAEVKNFSIPSLCGSIQINERDIIVFGGVENHSETNKSFIFRINEDNKKNVKFYLTDFNVFPLPFEGFCDTLPILKNKIAYTLIDSLKETSLNSKFLMSFTGKKWKKII